MSRVFDGDTANYIDCDPSGGGGNYSTLAAWIKLNSITNHDTICGGWESGDRSSVLEILSSGKLQFVIISAGLGAQAISSTHTLSLGEWIHVAGVYRGPENDQLVFINGVQEGIRDGTAATLDTSGSFRIGFRGDGPFSFDGKIEDVGRWDRGLVDGEIAALAAHLSPSRIQNGLLLHCPLWGKDSPELDLRQGVGATIVGTVAASDDGPKCVGSPWSVTG